MNITGRGKAAVDADLLARLAVAQGSGASVTKGEVASALKEVRSNLRESFGSSTSGLDRAAKAVAHTLEIAVKSGWVKSDQTVAVIEAFIKGNDKNGLKAIVKQLKADVGTYTPSPSRPVGT